MTSARLNSLNFYKGQIVEAEDMDDQVLALGNRELRTRAMVGSTFLKDTPVLSLVTLTESTLGITLTKANGFVGGMDICRAPARCSAEAAPSNWLVSSGFGLGWIRAGS